jgi:hypothetical protein
MPKSGSTLAFELTVAAARRAGFDQTPMGPGVLEGFERKGNFVGTAELERLGALLDWLEADGREMLVLKTHAEPTEAVLRALAGGRALAQAVCRDPRDIALSMLDAAGRKAAWGKKGTGQALKTTEDARGRIHGMIKRFKAWSEIEGTLCLNYEMAAFDTSEACRRIAGHMGVEPAPTRDGLAAKRAFTQFNKGRSQRHRDEMTPEQAAEWYARYKDFIETWCGEIPERTWPSRIGTQIGRLIRGG